MIILPLETDATDPCNGQMQRVRLANRERLLLRTPGPVPFGTCICSNIETILSWTCHVYGTFEFRTPLGTSILLYPKFVRLGKWFFPTRDRSVPKICMSWGMLSHPMVSHAPGWDNNFSPSFRAKYIMTSWHCQEDDVTIGRDGMTLCFVQLKWR